VFSATFPTGHQARPATPFAPTCSSARSRALRSASRENAGCSNRNILPATTAATIRFEPTIAITRTGRIKQRARSKGKRRHRPFPACSGQVAAKGAGERRRDNRPTSRAVRPNNACLLLKTVRTRTSGSPQMLLSNFLSQLFLMFLGARDGFELAERLERSPFRPAT
jgi:hypothetical protein